MQIRLSWQLLAAISIFLVAALFLARLLSQPREAAVPTAAPATAAPSGVTAPTAPVATPQPSVEGTTAPSRSPTAQPQPDPSATIAASATALPPSPPAPAPPAPSATAFASPSPTPTAAPEAVQLAAQGFAQSDTRVAYVFTVVNPNQDLIVSALPYQVVAYDAGGIVLRTATGAVDLVPPNQQLGVAGEVELLAASAVARIEVILGRNLYVAAVPLAPLAFENVALLTGAGSSVTGILRNPSTQDLIDLRVTAVVYGEGGTIIGGGSGTIAFVPAGGQAAVEIAVLAEGAVAGVELYALLSALPSP